MRNLVNFTAMLSLAVIGWTACVSAGRNITPLGPITIAMALPGVTVGLVSALFLRSTLNERRWDLAYNRRKECAEIKDGLVFAAALYLGLLISSLFLLLRQEVKVATMMVGLREGLGWSGALLLFAGSSLFLAQWTSELLLWTSRTKWSWTEQSGPRITIFRSGRDMEPRFQLELDNCPSLRGITFAAFAASSDSASTVQYDDLLIALPSATIVLTDEDGEVRIWEGRLGVAGKGELITSVSTRSGKGDTGTDAESSEFGA